MIRAYDWERPSDDEGDPLDPVWWADAEDEEEKGFDGEEEID